ncbi:MAG: hypothetical protein AAGC44_12445 [Planctomycetota bacterium]
MNKPTPYPVKVDSEFGRNYFVHNLWQVLLGGAGFLVTFISVWKTHTLGIWGIIGIAAFLMGIVQMALADRKRLKNYHCPSCGKHLQGPLIRELDKHTKDALTYDCDACQVTWDTRLRNGAD